MFLQEGEREHGQIQTMRYQNNQHFSHHHILISLQLSDGETIECSACEGHLSEPFHGCLPCQYYLHDCCMNTPRTLQHPSHPSHPLTLLPTPAYPSRSFSCNACGSEGKAFSLTCTLCEFDVHTSCASSPEAVRVDSHPHELKLVFDLAEGNKNNTASFVCDICQGEVQKNLWVYYCAACDFGAHLGCATPTNDGVAEEQKEQEEEEPKPGKAEQHNARSKNEAFDARRRMKAQHIANMAVLRALDNAADYVGSSHTRKEYNYY